MTDCLVGVKGALKKVGTLDTRDNHYPRAELVFE